MNQVLIHPFGFSTTEFGFGCSSLVGRLSEREAKALIDAAYASGIRHFDVARSYGGGAGESMLARALGNRRENSTITSKFGLPVRRTSKLARLARALLRPLAQGLSGLRPRSSVVRIGHVPTVDFTSEGAHQSLQTTLQELKTDRLDLFLLHEAKVDDLLDPRLLEFLQNAVEKGTIRAFGIGSASRYVPALLETRPLYCPVVQHESSVFNAVPPIPGSSFRITHGSLMGVYQQLASAFKNNAALATAASDSIGLDISRSENLSGLLLRSAVLKHPGSITLFSARSTQRIEQNVRSLSDTRLDDYCARFQSLLANRRELSHVVGQSQDGL